MCRDLTDEKVLSEALTELVSTLNLRRPTPEQAQIATYPPMVDVGGTKRPAPLLVVAGAGSGKTETLSLRATFMASHFGVPADAILGLTFTRKAAGELEQRLRERLESLRRVTGDTGPEGTGHQAALVLGGSAESMTYNAFALGVVREFGAHIGIDPQAVHMGEAAAWELMSSVVSQWPGELTESFTLASTVDKALELRQDIANQAMTMDEARRGIRRLLGRFKEAADEGKRSYTAFHRNGEEALRKRLQLIDIIEVFDEEMRVQGRMDYTQQVLSAIRVVKEVPEARAALRARHQVVFLDEFQDTSVAQMEFLSALFDDHPVTAVGDPNQAIYGWRGASAASLSDFHSMFNKEKGVPKRTMTLRTAWRNDRTILDAANVVAQPLTTRGAWLPSVAGAASGDKNKDVTLPKLEARPGAGRGTVGASYTHCEATSIEAMVAFVKQAKEQMEANLERDVSVAVLSRRAKALIPAVDALRRAGLPAQLAAGDALLLSPAVMDLRSALSVSADIGKSSDVMRLLTNLHLGALDLRALGNLARHLARGRGPGVDDTALLLEAVNAVTEGEPCKNLSEAGSARVVQLGTKLSAIRSSNDSGLVEQVQGARWAMDLDAEFTADPTTPGTPELLDQFTELAVEYEATTERPSLSTFLEWLGSVEAKEQGLRVPAVQVEPGAVQAMTIHSAKGLEWDVVVVIDMEDGRFPKSHQNGSDPEDQPFDPEAPADAAPQSGWWTDLGKLPYPLRRDRDHLPPLEVFDMSQTGKELQARFRQDVGDYLQTEERRLAYVALTRARSHLGVFGSWSTGGMKVRYPSIFLTEVAQTPGVTADLQSSPVGEALEAIQQADQSVSFPPGPSTLERQSAQAAAQIGEAREEILSQVRDESPLAFLGDPLDTALADRVLAGVGDRGLARRVALLLQEHRDNLQRRDPKTLSPEEVVRSIGSTRSMQVTEIARLQSDPEATILDLVRPVPSEPATAGLIGTAFHAWVEGYLKRLNASSGEEDEEELWALAALPLSPSDQEYLEQLEVSFAGSDVLDGFEIVALETPFSMVRDGVTVRGRIDAVLRDREGKTWLVDWKTRRFLPNEIRPETLSYYISQLRQYVEAWSARAKTTTKTATGNNGCTEKVQAALFFVAPQGVRAMTLRQLEKQLEMQLEKQLRAQSEKARG